MKLLPSLTMRIRPSFVVLCLIFGILIGKSAYAVFQISSLLAIVFFAHELGHVIVVRLFGRSCCLELTGGGGSTHVVGSPLIFWKRACVHSGGILATAFVAGSAQMYIDADAVSNVSTIFIFYIMNVVWFWLNLLPLYPFDMGEMLVDFLYTLLGPIGRKIGAFVSVVFAAIIAFISLRSGILLGAYFALYCIGHSWRLWQMPQQGSFSGDLSDEQKALFGLKDKWEQGAQEAVLEPLSLLAQKGTDSRVRQKAVEMYASYALQLEQPRKAYAVLEEAKDPLLLSSLEHMVLAAYKTSHWREGLASGRKAFQIRQTSSLAVSCALLAARLALEEEAFGWLRTAQSLGVQNVDEIFSSHDFDALRSSGRIRKVK